jgi:hypothetical protein
MMVSFMGWDVMGFGSVNFSVRISSVARRHASVSCGIREACLFQETLNTTSLSLYNSLGVDWRDSAALMQARPAMPNFSRAGDAAQLIAWEVPGFIRVVEGAPRAYLFGTLFGHAGAASDEDLLALAVRQLRCRLPASSARWPVPGCSAPRSPAATAR